MGAVELEKHCLNNGVGLTCSVVLIIMDVQPGIGAGCSFIPLSYPIMSTCKIELLEHHNGELGEAIQHEDHIVESECYHYDSGSVLEVAVHDDYHNYWHIFTDLDSGHRFKIEPKKYRRLR